MALLQQMGNLAVNEPLLEITTVTASEAVEGLKAKASVVVHAADLVRSILVRYKLFEVDCFF